MVLLSSTHRAVLFCMCGESIEWLPVTSYTISSLRSIYRVDMDFGCCFFLCSYFIFIIRTKRQHSITISLEIISIVCYRYNIVYACITCNGISTIWIKTYDIILNECTKIIHLPAQNWHKQKPKSFKSKSTCYYRFWNRNWYVFHASK